MNDKIGMKEAYKMMGMEFNEPHEKDGMFSAIMRDRGTVRTPEGETLYKTMVCMVVITEEPIMKNKLGEDTFVGKHDDKEYFYDERWDGAVTFTPENKYFSKDTGGNGADGLFTNGFITGENGEWTRTFPEDLALQEAQEKFLKEI